MPKHTLTIKNKQTGKAESIVQKDLNKEGWGFSFFTETETDAYKAAYIYRNAIRSISVEFAEGARQWMVTVFNSRAKELGLDGAK